MQAKLVSFDIPKRSPDLNVCDYALWKEVNRRMRKTELQWPTAKKDGSPLCTLRLCRSLVVPAMASRNNRVDMFPESPGGKYPEDTCIEFAVGLLSCVYHEHEETRNEFLARLRRTAMRLPATFINRAIVDMRRRCELLHAARGFHFQEGGRHS